MILKFLNKNFYINFSLVILVYLLDRLTKIFVIQLDKKLNEISKDVDFSELCITSSAVVSYFENSETKVQTMKAEGSKCPVCWKLSVDPCPRHSE